MNESLNYLSFFIEGSSLGLLTGISCAVFCITVLIGIASRNINNITPFIDFTFFLIGRLIAYIFIGILFSIIGMQLKLNNLFEIISKIIVAGLLIFWGIKGFIDSDKEKTNCSVKKFTKTVPFLAGILTGLTPCPPFIAGITRVLAVGNVLIGILYFFGFYITTSLFLIPSLSTGFLKYKKELKIIASFVSIIFGFSFLIMGIFFNRQG